MDLTQAPLTKLPFPFVETLEDFFAVLRRNGFEFGATSSLGAVEALTHIGIEDRNELRSALEGTLVRSSTDIPVFRSLFDTYFSTVTAELEREQTEPLSAAAQKQIDRQLSQDDEKLLQELMQGDWDSIQHRLQQTAEQVGLPNIQNFMQEGSFTYRMLEQMGGFSLQRAVNGAAAAMGSGAHQSGIEATQERIDTLFQAVRDQVRRQLRLNDMMFRERFREESLLNRNFFRASRDEREEMKQMLRKMAERLRTRVALRRRAAKGRQLHLSKTIRSSLATEGVPFKIRHKSKTLRKPQLVLLCDMSESVRAATEFMLLFVFSLQELFTKVNSFIFVAECANVTDVFRYNEFEQAVAEISTGAHLNLWANSDFGRAFRDFELEYMHTLTPQTTLIVLGDARGNYNDPQLRSFDAITSRVNRTIWLNPEPKGSWGFGDSLMLEYGPYCSELREVRTLAQLDAFVRSLVRL